MLYGFVELVEDFLQKGELDQGCQEKTLRLAMFSKQHEVFEILVANMELTLHSLHRAIRWRDYEPFLDLPSTYSNSHPDNGKEDALYCALIMERCPKLIFTKSMLKDAANSGNLEMLKVLFAHTAGQSVQEKGLVIRDMGSSGRGWVEGVEFLLHHGASITSEDLVWAAGVSVPIEIMENLFAHGGASHITGKVMEIAAGHPIPKMLEMLISHGGEVTQILLLHAVAAPRITWYSPHLLLQNGCNISGEFLREMMQTYGRNDILCYMLDRADEGILSRELASLLRVGVQRGEHTEVIAHLLARADDLVSNETMNDLMHIAINEGRQNMSKTVSLLLPRTSCFTISEAGFMRVIDHPNMTELVSELLDHAQENSLTEEFVIHGMRSFSLDVAKRLLARVDIKSVANDLLEAAAQNRNHGLELVEVILQHAELMGFPRIAFIQAARNKGQDIIPALEEHFGPAPMTSEDVLGYIQAGAHATFLKPELTRDLINEDILIAVIGNWNVTSQKTTIGRSLHLPITPRVLEAAALDGNTDCFMLLWSLAHVTTVPKSLVQAAAQSSCHIIFEFVLNESGTDECGEQLLQSLVYGNETKRRLQWLLDKGVRLDVTPNVIKLASAYPTLLSEGTVELLLQQNQDLVITDDIFQMAACSNDRRGVECLQRYSGRETLAQKWLDIAALYDAVTFPDAEFPDTKKIEELLSSGLHPEQIGLDGRTPLYEAAISGRNTPVLVMKILLSAGAKPDPVVKQHTPLHYLAKCHSSLAYEQIKILVEAGASLDCKDENGRTPAMIARRTGSVIHARYLERCEREQQEAKSKGEKSIPIPGPLMSDFEASNSQLALQMPEPRPTEDGKEASNSENWIQTMSTGIMSWLQRLLNYRSSTR